MSKNQNNLEEYFSKLLDKNWKVYSDKSNKNQLFELLFNIKNNLQNLNFKMDYLYHMLEEKGESQLMKEHILNKDHIIDGLLESLEDYRDKSCGDDDKDIFLYVLLEKLVSQIIYLLRNSKNN